MSLRVNLLLDQADAVRSGYLNIDPFAPPDDPQGRSKGDVADLRQYVDAAEADEIVALGILDRFRPQEADGVLAQWCSRVRMGGELTVSVVDFSEVARLSVLGEISLADANRLLFGEQARSWDLKRGVMTGAILKKMLEEKGFSPVYSRYEGVNFVVRARRER